MSFILDALKKSEIERQRQTVPGLMDARAAQRRSRLPVWAIALGALLAINLLVLTFALMRKGAPTPARPATSARAPEAAAPPPVAEHWSPLDTAPVYAPEIPVEEPASPAAAPPAIRYAPPAALSAGPSAAASGTASGTASAHRVHHPEPVLSEPDPGAGTENQEVLPSISEISLTGAQALPELHLDVHVYATKPSERFVYINMRKYHEGGKLQEGPAIERIRRDGVVLNYQGLRFVLPRQP